MVIQPSDRLHKAINTAIKILDEDKLNEFEVTHVTGWKVKFKRGGKHA